jgi:hypothetical protein
MRCTNRRGKLYSRDGVQREQVFLIKSVGLFSRKSPTFGVWLSLVNELQIIGVVAEENGPYFW